MSGIINKVKDAVANHGSSDEQHHTGTGSANAYDSTMSSNHGPHDSNITNAAVPRIDSSRSQMTGAGYNTGTTGTAAHNTMGGAPLHSTHGPASSTAGPHRSNMANEVDPRVDSDLSKERNNAIGSSRFDQDEHKSSIGGAGVMHGMGGSSGQTTTKTFEEAQHHGAVGSSYNSKMTAGPHHSNLANKLDPRVDSDLDGSKTIGSQRV